MTKHEWMIGQHAVANGFGQASATGKAVEFCDSRVSIVQRGTYVSVLHIADFAREEWGLVTIHVRNLSPLPEPPKVCRCGHEIRDHYKEVGPCWWGPRRDRPDCPCKELATDERRKTTRRVGARREWQDGEMALHVMREYVKVTKTRSGAVWEHGVANSSDNTFEHINRRKATADRRGGKGEK